MSSAAHLRIRSPELATGDSCHKIAPAAGTRGGWARGGADPGGGVTRRLTPQTCGCLAPTARGPPVSIGITRSYLEPLSAGSVTRAVGATVPVPAQRRRWTMAASPDHRAGLMLDRISTAPACLQVRTFSTCASTAPPPVRVLLSRRHTARPAVEPPKARLHPGGRRLPLPPPFLSPLDPEKRSHTKRRSRSATVPEYEPTRRSFRGRRPGPHRIQAVACTRWTS